MGRVNNVDLRYGFTLNGKTIDIAAASHRDNYSIKLFAIDPRNGFVTYLSEIKTPLKEIYGLCMAQDKQGKTYAIANDKDGRFFQYQLIDRHGELSYQLSREFKVASQP